MVRRNNAFMEQLVFDLLTISKKRAPEYEAADLNALCRDVCDMAVVRAEEKHVPLAFTPDESVPPVEVDPKGIRRCLLNLVTNAVDACEGGGGSVTVCARAPEGDGFARILVQDTGCGMSDEQKARLFAVFFSTKGSKGTGLGLPVTRKIVEEHNGRIEVDSREGEGTTFTIVLPVARPQTEAKGADNDGSGKEGPDS
jgi:signal transduction histidine kinase